MINFVLNFQILTCQIQSFIKLSEIKINVITQL